MAQRGYLAENPLDVIVVVSAWWTARSVISTVGKQRKNDGASLINAAPLLTPGMPVEISWVFLVLVAALVKALQSMTC